MRHQSEGEKKRKSERKKREPGLELIRFGELSIDSLVDPSIDPTDFFDPDEFGQGRKPNAPRP